MSSSPAPGAERFPRLTQAVEPDECIKILLATDNHIGYCEKDPIRGRDSINTFREILDLALANDVDLVLLAGDLFHENRPSRTSLYQTISLLRDKCLGDKPISVELVSDAGIGIARDASWPGVNYEDENLNVALPVFSIHGNHDDPQGVGAEGALCALDVLSASGLINYFGRMELPGQSTNDDEALEQGLKVKPVLLQKGSTKLALYGMGNVRDDRFMYEMSNKRIQLYRPAGKDQDEWFNIMLVHQNRVAHGPNKSVPDEAFGDEVDLVVWGHEHDCIENARPVPVTNRPYYISQPGSSIATSLAKGESIPKHVGLIKIQGKEFDFIPIRLRSVRPFVFEEISLAEYHDRQTDDKKKLTSKQAVTKFLKAKVHELIERANKEWDDLHQDEEDDEDEEGEEAGHERLLPLVRLRVDYSGGPDGSSQFEVGNPQRFGQDFIDLVANPRDLVQFHRKNAQRKAKVTINEPRTKHAAMAVDDEDDDGTGRAVEKVTVSALVHDYLEAQNLNVLSESLIQNAVEEFVGKGDKDAVGNWVRKLLKETRNEILKKDFQPSKEGPEHDDLENEMRSAKEAAEIKYGSKKNRRQRAGQESDEGEDSQESERDESAATTRRKGKSKAREPDSMDDDSDASSIASSSRGVRGGKTKAKAKPTTSTGKGKKAGVAGTTKKASTSTAARTRQTKLFQSADEGSDEESDDDEDDEPVVSQPKKTLAAKKKATTTTTTTTKKAPARASAAKKKTETIVMTDSDSDDDSDEQPAVTRKRRR